MFTIGTFVSIMIGIAVVIGLIKDGEMGCLQGCFVLGLILIVVAGIAFVALLYTFGGGY